MSSHPKIPKTNAARLLEKLAIAYSLHSAPVDEEDLSAVTMAHNLGVPPQCVFKTLVARGDKTGVLMAWHPGQRRAGPQSPGSGFQQQACGHGAS